MKQRSDGYLLRKVTLFLLWIVAIGCGFHMWSVNFNRHHSLPPDNNTCNNVENYVNNNSTSKINRTKRSTAESTSLIPNYVSTSKPHQNNNSTSRATSRKTSPTPGTTRNSTLKPTNKSTTSSNTKPSSKYTSESTTQRATVTVSKNKLTKPPDKTKANRSNGKPADNTTPKTNANYGTSTVKNEPDFHDRIYYNTTDHQADNTSQISANKTTETNEKAIETTQNDTSLNKNHADSFNHEIQVGNTTDQMNNTSQNSTSEIKEATESIETTTVENRTSTSETETSQTSSPFENGTFNVEKRICVPLDKHAIGEILRPFIRYYSLAWSVLGIISSLLGIYGIHKNISKLVAFSVFFFYFSILSMILIVLEINIDSNMEYRTFVLREFTGVAWNKCDLENTKLRMISMGFIILIAVSSCFAIIVNKFRRTMMKMNTEIQIDYFGDEDSDSDNSVPLKYDSASVWPNMYADAPQYNSEGV